MVRVVRQRGTVAELHALDPFADGSVADLEVWVCEPTDAAIVLGSRQRPEMLDREACERAGLSIVRRRSGGGAVVIRPAAVCWIDLIVPPGVAPDDVRGSMVWAGERWFAAIGPLLDHNRTTVHRGGLIDTAWSELVCFAGVGPGEILLGDQKLVGLSQRRNRHGLRIQGLVHRAPIDDDPGHLFVVDLPDAALTAPAQLPALVDPAVVEGVAAQLTRV